MNAGRELDIAIAEKVMGLSTEVSRYRGFGMPGASVREPTLPYSISIAAAWEVVGRFAQQDWRFLLFRHSDGFRASFIRWDDMLSNLAEGQADTAALAICLAALKACEVKVPA